MAHKKDCNCGAAPGQYEDAFDWHSDNCPVYLRGRIAELEGLLIGNGICPACGKDMVCDYRAGKATNRRCRCGWALNSKGGE